jgi:hypothetical protein
MPKSVNVGEIQKLITSYGKAESLLARSYGRADNPGKRARAVTNMTKNLAKLSSHGINIDENGHAFMEGSGRSAQKVLGRLARAKSPKLKGLVTNPERPKLKGLITNPKKPKLKGLTTTFEEARKQQVASGKGRAYLNEQIRKNANAPKLKGLTTNPKKPKLKGLITDSSGVSVSRGGGKQKRVPRGKTGGGRWTK